MTTEEMILKLGAQDIEILKILSDLADKVNTLEDSLRTLLDLKATVSDPY